MYQFCADMVPADQSECGRRVRVTVTACGLKPHRHANAHGLCFLGFWIASGNWLYKDTGEPCRPRAEKRAEDCNAAMAAAYGTAANRSADSRKRPKNALFTDVISGLLFRLLRLSALRGARVKTWRPMQNCMLYHSWDRLTGSGFRTWGNPIAIA
jgi:hypothetical protein